MAKLNEDKFDVFDDPTPPRADNAGPREESDEGTQPPPPRAPRQPKRPRALKEAEVPAELSASQERWILHGVRAALGKVAAERARLDEAEEALSRELADARAKGIDERKLLGAALSAGVDLPDAE